MTQNYLLIFLTISLSVTAQTLLKLGMRSIGKIEVVSAASFLPLAVKMGTNLYVLAGLSLFAIGTFVWLVLLSRLDLSFLYPFGALQYIFIFLVSYFLLGEEIKLSRIIGVIIILFGIFVISKFE